MDTLKLAQVFRQSGSVPTAMTLAGVYGYSRLQAATTSLTQRLSRKSNDEMFAAPPGASIGTRLAASALAVREVDLRMRDGSHIRCRIADAGGVLSVHVDADYIMPDLDWDGLSTIVDIGAHVGAFSVWAARRAPRARVLAVEPNPRTYALLRANVRDNGLDHRVTTIHAAVGIETGSASLDLEAHSLGTRVSTGTAAGDIPVITLADVVHRAGSEIGVLKVDTEGLEYELFDRLPPGLLSCVRNLALEYHPVSGHHPQMLVSRLTSERFAVSRSGGAVGIIWAVRRA